MSPLKFQSWFKQAKQKLLRQQHRQLVVLVGSKTWAHSLLSTIDSYSHNKGNESWAIYSADKLFFLNDNKLVFNKSKVAKKNYRHYLGTQYQYLVFDDKQLTIDAFAALSGTISAGGMLFLLWPESLDDSVLIRKSLFLQRFFEQIVTDKNALIFEQGIEQKTDFENFIINSPKANELQNSPIEVIPLTCKTREQFKAVKAVQKVFTGHRNRPLVLTADRGRGKSSALAIACAELIKNTEQALSIIICAPHQQAVDIFFTQLAHSLELENSSKTELTYAHIHLKNQLVSRVTFVPIDILLKDLPQTSLLLIDEAAAIPVYLLEKVIEHYHRVVFATTQHGYEGAGRGFALKFQQHLQCKTPNYKRLHIKQPIRWAKNDPLEQFVFFACLLNAELEPLNQQQVNLNSLSLIRHNKADLLKNEKLLTQLFSVLVTAHYQTSPSDLRLMLDNKQVTIVSLSHESVIVAVALLISEGMCANECQQQVIQGVKQGQQRLKDQFLPQSLINHCGFEQAFDYRYLRIMRIAVHPQIQQQGIGRYFLAQLSAYAQQQQVDFLGTSFGANCSLLKFWLAADFKLMRIGFTKDQASGEHSALLLKAISIKSAVTLTELNREFYRSFHYLLSEAYQHLSTKLVRLILQNTLDHVLPPLTLFDQQNIDAFANKKRLYYSCVFSLHLWLLQHLADEGVNDEAVLLLIARILQKRSVSDVCQQFNLTGKKALNQQLVDYMQQYYQKKFEDTETSSA